MCKDEALEVDPREGAPEGSPPVPQSVPAQGGQCKEVIKSDSNKSNEDACLSMGPILERGLQVAGGHGEAHFVGNSKQEKGSFKLLEEQKWQRRADKK
jgi:hypothetical protein